MEIKAPIKTPEVTSIEQPYRITVNDRGIIEVAFFGVQTEQTIEKLLLELKPVMDGIANSGNPVNLLADNARVTRTTTAANQRVLRAYNEMTFHKLAGMNANTVLRFVLNAIVTASGKSSKIKMFNDQASAEAWLLKP